MPVNVVKTPEDERLWEKAKSRAKEEGREKDWPYVMGIFQKMKGKPKKASAFRVAFRFRFAKLTDEAREKAIDLLAGAKGKPLDDKKVHALAEELGMDADELETEIYAWASLWAMNEKAKVNPGGRAEAKGVTREDFPKATIEQGIKVELEHTKDREMAERIVLDHLAESPKYYEALDKMEKGLEEGKQASRYDRLMR